jgi:hypothetical protein
MSSGGPGALRCTVWFYDPASERTTGWNFVNKLVAGLSPPYCHVELQFPSGMACSVVMGDNVRMRERTFDPEFYTGVVLYAPPQAVFKTLALAQAHVDSATPFGVSAGHTFCSKLVAELLRDGGLVPAEALGDGWISPSALYQQLTRLHNVVVLPAVQQVVSAPTPALDFAAPALPRLSASLRLQ